MPKHRKNTRKNQKGGFSLNPLDLFRSSDPNAPKRSWSDWAFGTTSGAVEGASSLLSSATNSVTGAASSFGSSIGNALNSNVNLLEGSPAPSPGVAPASGVTPVSGVAPASGVAPTQDYNQTNPAIGGRRKKQNRTMKKGKRRQMKGGKGGLGLTYYASPVSGLKVAEPTYWEVYANGTNQYTTKGGSKRRTRNGRKSRRL